MSRRMLLEDNYSENGLIPVTDGLICWLDGRDAKTGDTTWKDRSGNGNDAVFINDKTIFENGKLTLNGDNYANLPFGQGEDVNKHCLCAYASKNANTYKGMIVSGGIGNNQRKFFDITQGPYPRLGYCNNTSVSKQGIIYNKLNHLVWNAEDFVKLYVNGIIDIKVTREENIMLSRNFVIGTNDPTYPGQDLWLKGNIASILIYNRALTEEEIQQNYLYEQSIERG